MNNEEKILEEVTKIARSKLPISMTDKWSQERWIAGFINGYLERTIEEVKQQKLKN